jgi:hypothetical protein
MTKLSLEVADTPAALAQGLMFRKDLPKNQGMLFKFPRILEANFWGKNTYIPLDIAFIDDRNVITAIKPITPMSTKMVRSDGDCVMAVEAHAGFFDKNNIFPGHIIDFIKDKEGKEIEAVFKVD